MAPYLKTTLLIPGLVYQLKISIIQIIYSTQTFQHWYYSYLQHKYYFPPPPNVPTAQLRFYGAQIGPIIEHNENLTSKKNDLFRERCALQSMFWLINHNFYRKYWWLAVMINHSEKKVSVLWPIINKNYFWSENVRLSFSHHNFYFVC